MKENQQPNLATRGYVLVVIGIVALAFVLALPHASVSIAQESTRPAPPPTRPGTIPTRDTPLPPTAPPPTVPLEPTTLPGTPAPESPATTTATPPILPDSGGMTGYVIVLLVAGLALTAMGVSSSVIHRRRQSAE